VIFGENLLALLVLALGGALAAGNLLALIRPREHHPDHADDEELLEQAPLARSLAMIALGLTAAVWALASLLAAEADEPVDEAIDDGAVFHVDGEAGQA